MIAKYGKIGATRLTDSSTGLLKSPTAQTWLTNIAILAFGLCNSVVLARELAPKGRGEIAAVLIWPLLLTYLGSLGQIDAILYYAAAQSAKLGEIVTIGLLFAAGQSAVLLLIGYAAMPALLSKQSKSVVESGQLALLIVPSSLVGQYAISILQSKLKFHSVNLLRCVIPIGYLCGTVLLLALATLTVRNVVLVQLILNVATAIVAALLLLKSGVYPARSINRRLARGMAGYGLKVQAGAIAGVGNLRLDQVLMASLISPAQLGLYSVAVGTSSMTQTLSQAVRLVLTPQLAQQETPEGQRLQLVRAFRNYWFLNLLLTPLLAVAVFIGIPVLYGEAFGAARLTAEVLVLASIAMGAKEVLTGGARAFGFAWMASKAELIALLLTATLLIALLPTIGIMGAAIASLASYTFALMLLVRWLRKETEITARSLFWFQSG